MLSMPSSKQPVAERLERGSANGAPRGGGGGGGGEGQHRGKLLSRTGHGNLDKVAAASKEHLKMSLFQRLQYMPQLKGEYVLRNKP